MKKLFCIALALALVFTLSPVALAQSTPSKTVGDLLHFDVVAQDDAEGIGRIIPVHEATIGENIDDFELWVKLGAYELQKLLESQGKGTYFGDVTDGAGHDVDLREELHSDEVYIFEFYPVIAYGFEPGFGEVQVELNFPTFYSQDMDVVMLVGFVQKEVDGEMTVNWIEYEVIEGKNGLSVKWTRYDDEGVLEDVQAEHHEIIEWTEYPVQVMENGGLLTVWPEELVMDTQENMVLLAIAHSEKNAQ